MLIKLEWLGYSTVKNYDDMLSRFYLIPYVTHRQTDTQTVRQTDEQTDRRTELLYQCRALVCWRAIKMLTTISYVKFKTISWTSFTYLYFCTVARVCLLFCCAMLCISAAYAVMLCLCVSVTFVNSVKTNRHSIKIFSPSGSHTILVFPCQTA